MILEEIQSLSEEWLNLLQPYLDNGGRGNLQRLYKLLSRSTSFYPCIPKAFLPLKRLKPSEIKVVIVGQDPYPCSHLATGIAFSLPEGQEVNNQCVGNIFQAMMNDVGGTMPSCGNLDYLTEQGVFLVNASSTFPKQKEWHEFTKFILKALADSGDPKVFMLWGGDAKQVGHEINKGEHLVFKVLHPSYCPKCSGGNQKCSPEKCKRGVLFINKVRNCKHFSKTNEFLRGNGDEEINGLK